MEGAILGHDHSIRSLIRTQLWVSVLKDSSEILIKKYGTLGF